MLNEIMSGLIANRMLQAALSTMVIAQVLKVVYYSVVNKKLQMYHFFEAGGMPSSHSALVSSLSTMIGLKYKFDSGLFAVTAVFASIVMYDAVKVRHEDVGHTLVEVFSGAVFGILFSLLAYKLFI